MNEQFCGSCGTAAPKAVYALPQGTSSTQRRRNEEEDEEPAKKKIRDTLRELDPLLCVGLGEPGNSLGNGFNFLTKLLRPANSYLLADVDDTFKSNASKMEFAMRFHVPLFEEDCEPCALSTDVGVHRHSRDNISKLLYALIMTTPRSELDLFKGVVYDAALPQFTPDRKSCKMLNGCMGGVVGRTSISLWSINSSTTHLSTLMQEILVQIVQASKIVDKKMPMWYCVTTPSTSLQVHQNTVVGGRFETKSHFSREEAAFDFKVEDDIDDYLLTRIGEYRNVERCKVVPQERNHHDKYLRFADDDFPQKVAPSKLFSVHVMTEVHTGRHKNGDIAKITTHEIRLTSELPGSDMCVLLRQASAASPELKNNLTELWRTNMLDLKAEGHLDTENMYSPNSPVSVFYITCPAVIKLALFTFADANGITNLDSLPRIDVRDESAVNLYKQRLFEARDRGAAHYNKVFLEVHDHDLHMKKQKNCHLPVQDFDPVVYDPRGWHIRSFPLEKLQALKEDHKNTLEREQRSNTQTFSESMLLATLQDIDQNWDEWQKKQLQCNALIYFTVFGWKAELGGVTVRINTDVIPSTTDKTQGDWQMPMLEDCSTMVSLYLNTKKEAKDNLDIFWAGQESTAYQGHVADMKWIKANLSKNIPTSVLKMHTALNQPPISLEDSLLRTKNPREYAIKEMMGVSGCNEYEEHMKPETGSKQALTNPVE